MPAPIYLIANVLWVLIFMGIIAAIVRLHYQVKRAAQEHKSQIVQLEQQQRAQVKRIETLEHKHQTVLQEIANVLDQL